MQTTFANIGKKRLGAKRGVTFSQLYKDIVREEKNTPLPSRRFIKEVSEVTCKSEMTVRGWLSGRIPAPLEQETIAKHLGIPVHVLFPPRINDEQQEHKP